MGYQAKKSKPPEKRTPPKGGSNVTPPPKNDSSVTSRSITPGNPERLPVEEGLDEFSTWDTEFNLNYSTDDSSD